MIEDLIQEIHLCRNKNDLDTPYSEVVDGFVSSYYSYNMAEKAIKEINHRLYADYGIVIPREIIISGDYLLTESSTIITTEKSQNFIV